MRFVKPYVMSRDDEERAMETMIRRRNSESVEVYDEETEKNIKIVNKHHYFQSAVGAFVVDFQEGNGGFKYEYITRFKIKTKGKTHTKILNILKMQNK